MQSYIAVDIHVVVDPDFRMLSSLWDEAWKAGQPPASLQKVSTDLTLLTHLTHSPALTTWERLVASVGERSEVMQSRNTGHAGTRFRATGCLQHGDGSC